MVVEGGVACPFGHRPSLVRLASLPRGDQVKPIRYYRKGAALRGEEGAGNFRMKLKIFSAFRYAADSLDIGMHE